MREVGAVVTVRNGSPTAAFVLESVNFNFGGHSTIFGHWLDALMGSQVFHRMLWYSPRLSASD